MDFNKVAYTQGYMDAIELLKVAFTTINTLYDKGKQGGEGAMRASYIKARDMAYGYPKAGNKKMHENLRQKLKSENYPVDEWDKDKPKWTNSLF
jgi:protoporphyrinogen oxidase